MHKTDTFSLTSCPKPKDTKSIINCDKEKQQNLTEYLVFLFDTRLKKIKSLLRVSLLMNSLLKFLLSFLCDSKLNIFGLWRKQDI